jgi:cobalamin biosynthesis Mg chelatase CobN
MTEDPLLVVAPTKPGSPTDISASSDPGQASIVSWVIPENDGGEPITGYIATASPGGNSCTADGATATSCTITDLNADTSYTFTVRAINQVGPSDPSDASNNPDVDPTPTPSADAEGDAEGDSESDSESSFAKTTEATASTPSPSPSKSAPSNLEVPTQTSPAPQAIAAETDSPDFGLMVFWSIAIAVLFLVALLVTLWRRRFTRGV